MVFNWQAIAIVVSLFVFIMGVYYNITERARRAEFEILKMSIQSLEKSVEKHEASIGKKVDYHSAELQALRGTIGEHAVRMVKIESILNRQAS